MTVRMNEVRAGVFGVLGLALISWGPEAVARQKDAPNPNYPFYSGVDSPIIQEVGTKSVSDATPEEIKAAFATGFRAFHSPPALTPQLQAEIGTVAGLIARNGYDGYTLAHLVASRGWKRKKGLITGASVKWNDFVVIVIPTSSRKALLSHEKGHYHVHWRGRALAAEKFRQVFNRIDGKAYDDTTLANAFDAVTYYVEQVTGKASNYFD